MMTDTRWQIGTTAVHAGQQPDPATNARAVPIYQTSSYVFNSAEHAAALFSLSAPGNIYTRLMNPTTDVLEQRVAAIEGGIGALATASGMAAITLAILTILKQGDHIVSSASLYGGTDTLFNHTLPRMGITVTFLADPSAANFKKAVRPNTRLFYGETIGNPKGDFLDLAGIAAAAQAASVPLMIDNTFAPTLCQPLVHGANIVVHSLTKWLGGHGSSLGGIIVDGGNFNWANGKFPEFTAPFTAYHFTESLAQKFGPAAFITRARIDLMRNIGPCLSPFNAFQLLQGIETIHLRMPRHCTNTMALAEYLQGHPCVAWVNYTGLPGHPHHELAGRYLDGGYGAVLGFGIRGGFAAAKKFIAAVKLCSHLANVGDAKTLVIHPASTTHQQLDAAARQACGISDDFIRVAVGIEDVIDLVADLDQALRAACGK